MTAIAAAFTLIYLLTNFRDVIINLALIFTIYIIASLIDATFITETMDKVELWFYKFT